MADKVNFGDVEHSSKRVCEDCLRAIDAEDRVAVYFTNKVWFQGEEQNLPSVKPMEFYCFDCYPNEIPLPHLGSNEGFYLAEASKEDDETYLFKERMLLKGSSRREGLKWDPLEVFENHFPAPAEEYPYGITPMHIFSIFRKSGIDLRGFIRDNLLEIPDDIQREVAGLVELSQHKHQQESNPLTFNID